MLEKNFNKLVQDLEKAGQIIANSSKNKLSDLLQHHLSHLLKILNIPSRQQIALYEKRLAELEGKIKSLRKQKAVK